MKKIFFLAALSLGLQPIVTPLYGTESTQAPAEDMSASSGPANPMMTEDQPDQNTPPTNPNMAQKALGFAKDNPGQAAAMGAAGLVGTTALGLGAAGIVGAGLAGYSKYNDGKERRLEKRLEKIKDQKEQINKKSREAGALPGGLIKRRAQKNYENALKVLDRVEKVTEAQLEIRSAPGYKPNRAARAGHWVRKKMSRSTQ